MIITGVLLAGTGVTAGVWYYFTNKYTDVGYMPVQPVAFSHAIHADQLGMDCRYCHNAVEKSWYSNIPASSVCMNCHNQVLKDDPKLAARPRELAIRQADSLGPDPQAARLRLFQPFRPRQPRRQLRGMPRPDQQDGRSTSGQAVEHVLLPGLPSRSRRPPASARTKSPIWIGNGAITPRKPLKCRRPMGPSSSMIGRSNPCRTAPPVTDENNSSTLSGAG